MAETISALMAHNISLSIANNKEFYKLSSKYSNKARVTWVFYNEFQCKSSSGICCSISDTNLPFYELQIASCIVGYPLACSTNVLLIISTYNNRK